MAACAAAADYEGAAGRGLGGLEPAILLKRSKNLSFHHIYLVGIFLLYSLPIVTIILFL